MPHRWPSAGPKGEEHATGGGASGFRLPSGASGGSKQGVKPNRKELKRIRVIRENVRALREGKGMTQRELAELSGHSYGSIRELETGGRCGFNVVLLVHIADALGVTPRVLLKGFE